MKRAYLTTLTPLRGIAALLMVVFHFNMLVLPIINPAITQLHRRWYLFVDFFFILSGFIITYVYGSWFEDRVLAVSFRRYMAARFARIYPLHILTLLWVIGLYLLLTQGYHVVLDPIAQGVFDASAIPMHVLMLHGFNTVRSATWNTPSWSIGSEWLLYLLFPILMLGFRRLPSMGRFALLLVVLGLYYYLTKSIQAGQPYKPWLWLLPNTLDNITFPMSFLRCFTGFLLGMITYHAYNQQSGLYWLRRSWVFVALGIGLAISYHLQLSDTLTIWFFPLLILGACYNTGRVSKLLQTRPFQRLGDWSYSIYMVHMPILFSFLTIQLINPPAPSAPAKPLVYGLAGPITCIVFVAIVLGVSALSYRFVELPARSYLNRKLKSRQLTNQTLKFS
ncbi:acyltransferase family protein [Spirosoma endbachense]|uniref:Acyltransferase family protein n=1 Tax=Spirosoma endbachense TaxID=2666025 RepID=A0A6P1W5E0_9BACT|nr:acyltransferase [Spirosoma endbachense]QHV99562.1 acyltransferase family protein [Spirosoma endbachense]